MELCAALIRLTRKILRIRLSIQGVRDYCREAVCRVLIIRFIHAPGSHLERIIDNNDTSRLIVRTNLLPQEPDQGE